MMKRIMSLLNPIVPLGLASKGLEKIDPRMKSFFSGAAAAGYAANEAVDFLRDQFESPGQREAKEQELSPYLRPDEQAANARMGHEQLPSKIIGTGAKLGAAALGGAGLAGLTAAGMEATSSGQQIGPESQEFSLPGGFENFMSKHPDLGRFLQKEISAGLQPEEAAIKAKGVRKFRDIIQGIEENVGQSFEDLLAQFFQGSDQPRAPQQQQQQGSMSPAMSQFMQALQEYKNLAGRQGG